MNMEELFNAMQSGEVTAADLENEKLINTISNQTPISDEDISNYNPFIKLTTPEERKTLRNAYTSIENEPSNSYEEIIKTQRKNIPNLLQDKADLLFNKYNKTINQLNSLDKNIAKAKESGSKVEKIEDEITNLNDKIDELQTTGDKSIQSQLALLKYNEKKQQLNLVLDNLKTNELNSSNDTNITTMKQARRSLVDDLKLIKKAFDDLAQERLATEKDNDFLVMRNILGKELKGDSEQLANAIVDYEEDPTKFEPIFKNSGYPHANFKYDDHEYKNLFKELGL